MGTCCTPFKALSAKQFDARVADGDLRRYRRKGPNPTTRLLRDEILAAGGGGTLVDVGAGIGALSFELLAAGFTHAIAVDASHAYAAAACQESGRRDLTARFEVREGDFVEVASQVAQADVVALDRVVCCYPGFEALLLAATGRSRRLLAFSYPRDRWYIRTVVAAQNAWRALRRNPFRMFLHPPHAMETLVEREGFGRVASRTTRTWSVVVFAREG